MASRIADERLADLATRHLRETWAQLAAFRDGEVLERANVVAYATGHPAYAANGCVVSGPMTTGDLGEVLTWLEQRAPRYLLTIDDRHTAPICTLLSERGWLIEGQPVPGMAVDDGFTMPRPAAGIEVVPVDGSNYDEWAAITGAIYSGEAMTRLLWPATLLARPEVTAVIGRIGGQYVSVATIMRTGATAGVYAVATLAEHRRQGVGAAVTAAAVASARDQWGTRSVFLQSSEIAVSVYAALGFRTVVGYRMFGIATERV